MHSSGNKNFGVRRSLEKLYGFSIDTVNMYFGDIQSRLDLCISLLQQEVNNNKMRRSNFIWHDTKWMFTVSIEKIGRVLPSWGTCLKT